MGLARIALAVCIIGLGVPALVTAQSLMPDQERELKAWMSQAEKWLRDQEKWPNRPKRDSLGRYAARTPLPATPPWLEEQCGLPGIGAQELLLTACRLLKDVQTQLAPGILPAPPTPDRAARNHTSFATRMHVDGLGMTAATGARTYGIVGSHMSLVDVGRFQFYGPPGVLVLSVPDAQGTRRITIGYTWGVSLRLADMRLFGQRDMTLFLNVSKVWVGANAGRGLDLVGFSISPRR